MPNQTQKIIEEKECNHKGFEAYNKETLKLYCKKCGKIEGELIMPNPIQKIIEEAKKLGYVPEKKEIEDRFIEIGADLEHDRWARWQEYFFSKCTWHWLTEIVKDGNTLTLPKELHARWLRQIKTPYSELSEKEKESDRKETKNYLPLIHQAIDSYNLEKVIELAYERGQENTLNSLRQVVEADDDGRDTLEEIIKETNLSPNKEE